MRGGRNPPVKPADNQIVYYETEDGQSHVCAIDAAQSWLRDGYFTSKMKFSLVPDKGGTSEHRVRTLDELISHNGRSMPFLSHGVDGERNDVKTVESMLEELSMLNRRRLEVVSSMKSLQDRMIAAHAEMLLINERIESLPSVATRDETTQTADLFTKMAEKLLQHRIESSINTLTEQPAFSFPPPAIDLSLLRNPISEIQIPGVEEFVQLTAIEKILRIEGGQAFPIDGIDPFEVLCHLPDSTGEVNYQPAFEKKMNELRSVRDKQRFNTLVGHLVFEKQVRCMLCNITLSPSIPLHIATKSHVRRMKRDNQTYPMESIAFWMYALRIAQRRAPWFPSELVEKKQKHSKKEQSLEIPLASDDEEKQDEAREPPVEAPIDSLSLVDNTTHPSFDFSLTDDPEAEKSVSPEVIGDETAETVEHHIEYSSGLVDRTTLIIDLSLMRNPMTEVLIPGGAEFAAQFAHQMAVNRLLKIENGRVFPINDIDPFQILRCFPAGEAIYQNSFEVKMGELLSVCDEHRLQYLANHLCLGKKIFCALCEIFINNDPSSLIEHIITVPHTKTMTQCGSMYPLEAVAFWMFVLRMAEKNAPWSHVNEKEEENEVIITEYQEEQLKLFENEAEEEVKKESNIMETGDSFSPSVTSLPIAAPELIQASELVAIPTTEDFPLLSNLEKIMSIDGGKALPKNDVDPFDVLRPFSVPVGEVNQLSSLHHELYRLYLLADRRRLNLLVGHIFVKNYTYTCLICQHNIAREPSGLIAHIVSYVHISKMQSSDLCYPLDALAYWIHALSLAQKEASQCLEPPHSDEEFDSESQESKEEKGAAEILEDQCNKEEIDSFASQIDESPLMSTTETKEENGENQEEETKEGRKEVSEQEQEEQKKEHEEAKIVAQIKPQVVTTVDFQPSDRVPSISHLRLPPDFDISLIVNPMIEIAHHDSAIFAKEVALRTDSSKILRITCSRIFPGDGINPFAVLTEFPVTLGKATYQKIAHKKLSELISSRDVEKWDYQVSHLFGGQKLFCTLCSKPIKNQTHRLVAHINDKPHRRKMRNGNMVFPLEAFAYWMYTLSIAKRPLPTKDDEEKLPFNAFPSCTSSATPLMEKVVSPLPEMSTRSILSFNISMMSNPFHEIKHQGDSNFLDDLKERTAAGGILRFKENIVFPMYDVDPFDVLCLFPAPLIQEQNTVQLYAAKLNQLRNQSDKARFESLTAHLLVENDLRCLVCVYAIGREAAQLVKHISSHMHIAKMKKRKLVYKQEAVAFWLLALRIAKKGAHWFPPRQENKMYIPNSSEEEGEIPVKSSIDPNYYLPLSLLHNVTEVPNSCKDVRLVAFYMHRKLKSCVDIDKLRNDEKVRELIGDEKRVSCEACPSYEKVRLGCPDDFIKHIVSSKHINSMLSHGGQVETSALFFWIDAMSRASKDRKEVVSRRLSPLNRLLVTGVADPTSPIALLVHCREAPDPCPDYARAMSMLATKLRKCDVKKFNEAMNQYFGEALLCGVCVEFKRIRSGSDFIDHITTDNHIENATARDGQVTKKALRFWLNALCAAGAIIPPLEQDKTITLFGEE